MKKILLTLFVLFITLNSRAQNAPKRELRGVWISTHLSLDWPNRTQTPEQQQSALIGILNHNQATGMNAAFFQVRSQADAMYPSTLEPWSYYLTNNQGTAPSPMWDPLQFAIDETHKRGMEFHAWINPYRAVANTANANIPAQYTNTHVSKAHPEWMLTVGTVRLLNPGLPEVRDHVTNVIVDIIKRYDVNGIHFDDYFYPSGTTGDDAAYNADPRGFPATTAGRADWRRDNINLLIKRVADSINAIKPWVKFGVSPSGIYRSSTDPAIGSPTSSGALQHYSALFADSKKWIQEGWVDYLAPQIYWYIGQTGSDYKLLIPWWNNNAFGRHIYAGIASYKVNDPAQGPNWALRSQIPNQVKMNRDSLYPNVQGEIYFRHAFLAANALNHRDSLKLNLYNKPALLPTMPWKDNIAPAAPTSLTIVKNADNTLISWTKPAETSNEFDKVKRFVIYRSESPSINTENVNNILAITNTNEISFTDITAGNGTFYYAVSSLDRFQNESSLTSTVSSDTIKPTVITKNITRKLSNGTVSISAQDVDNGSFDNWGIDTLTLNQSTFSCGNIGDNIVTLTVIDKAGNIDSATAVITITGTLPQLGINLSRVDNTFTGLSDSTIALGYGAQDLILTASNSNPSDSVTTYKWSPSVGLSAVNSAQTVFTPTIAGTYTFNVEAINEFGCSSIASKTIRVIDARCGNNKISICKKTDSTSNSANQICVSQNAVQVHLRNGAKLGLCDNDVMFAFDIDEIENAPSVLIAYPNPITSQTIVCFTLPEAEKQVTVDVYDLNGKKLMQLYKGNVEANKTYTFPLDISKFEGQIFNAKLITTDQVYNFKLIKE